MTSISSQKNWFTVIRSTEKSVSQLFGIDKNWFIGISILTNTVAATWRKKKKIHSIWRPKNVVHNC